MTSWSEKRAAPELGLLKIRVGGIGIQDVGNTFLPTLCPKSEEPPGNVGD